MDVLSIVLLLVIIALIFSFATLEKNLREAKKQLDRMRENESKARISLSSPNRAAEELFAAINQVLDLRESSLADFHRQERSLREQISNVSHDLRTPLTSILGYLQLLEDPGLGEEERRQYLKVIETRAKALQNLITAFYDLTRIEGGSYPLEREQVDLYRVLSELAAEYYDDLERSGLTVEIDLNESLPPVWGDYAAVVRVFTNLIGNALKHGKGVLRIALYQAGDVLATEFSNDGVDLTQEDAAHVFDRFYTADKTRSAQNSGLGMSIVRALIQQMGHEVTAELREGIFTVRLLWKPVVKSGEMMIDRR